MEDLCCVSELVVVMFLQVSCVVVLSTGLLAFVVVRREPPFGVSALSVLSLLTGAQKSYVGTVNICHSPRRISPRMTLDDDKQSPDVPSGAFV
jgi:hypothetical protein